MLIDRRLNMVLNILRKLFERNVSRLLVHCILPRIPYFTVVVYCLILLARLCWAFHRHLGLRASGHLSLLFEMLDLLMKVLRNQLAQLNVRLACLLVADSSDDLNGG